MEKAKARKFVRFNLSEFKAALSYLPGNYRNAVVKAWEYVFDIEVPGATGIIIRIYSSVDKITGYSRDKGADKIKMFLVNEKFQTPMSESESILRTVGWSARLPEKISLLSAKAHKMICPNCHIPLVKRTGRNGDFLGCQNFPDCKQTSNLIH